MDAEFQKRSDEPRRILVIDDNRDAADTLVALLQAWGYDSQAVYNGVDALRTATHFRPDCILSDIHMPGLDGYQVAERLRQDEALSSVTLIAISATYDPERVKSVGFNYNLTKPADPLVLQRLLQVALGMDKLIEKAEKLLQKNSDVVGESNELIKEVKGDVEEIKQDLKEVKEDVQALKEKLDEADSE